ncbi:unnamed protein product [Protopolystoma xenopodis]|uniref:Uncharacterized protein n=1 Tax=Protopolystoma xenopodis TaxID=117903 RepID=A0A3S5FHA0_9PLAT|nr:unnamed protein product [Protopolystoma xenopodis]
MTNQTPRLILPECQWSRQDLWHHLGRAISSARVVTERYRYSNPSTPHTHKPNVCVHTSSALALFSWWSDWEPHFYSSPHLSPSALPARCSSDSQQQVADYLALLLVVMAPVAMLINRHFITSSGRVTYMSGQASNSTV